MEDAKTAIRGTLSQVKALLAQDSPPKLSESDTKANFIDPILAALGWSGIGVVTREYYVKNSREYIDYVMGGPDGAVLAVEAKALQSHLTDKHAAQLVQYCAVEGIEWAALTNGRQLQFFNTFLKRDLVAKRVLRLDLLAFDSDEEFDALFGQIWQLSREWMSTPAEAWAWLNQRRLDAALRATLLDPGSPILGHLRDSLADAEVSASSEDLAVWFRNHLGSSGASSLAPDRSLEKTQGETVPPMPDNAIDSGEGIELFDAAQSSVFASGGRALLPLFESLHRAVQQQWPDTQWRSTRAYIAAASPNGTFLALKRKGSQLRLGLPLPMTLQSDRLEDNAAEFSWARMTRVAPLESVEDIDQELLSLLRSAREGTSGGSSVGS